ncbi:hypothetical protein SASPL_115119 [Salvia splendens]|uniref:Uncharacterized protein n=1 Tax=Salvia splendens TaxID=180675 RepID=A0A8X8Y4K8_SALSN|nr:hypothetical protein SASPL_115119 [Salvia splendens]
MFQWPISTITITTTLLMNPMTFLSFSTKFCSDLILHRHILTNLISLPPLRQNGQLVSQISALNSCSTCGLANVSPDDCDYENEEAAAEKPRCSTKRTRAAEVHNLSEKVRIRYLSTLFCFQLWGKGF